MAVASLCLLGSGLPVDVDSDGFFASADHAAGAEAFPGAGVRLVAVDAAHGRLVGRMDQRAEAPFVWIRAADGTLTPHALRPSPTSGPLRAAAVAAALAALPAAARSETIQTFEERCGALPDAAGPAPPGDAAVPYTSRAPVPPASVRTTLDEWAPREDLFVRFRSVEAAYRVADEADRLAGALLAVESEDARDYGTLRLVLHDLLLPTIWRTNPDAQRGVGEVGLVVAPPFVRGRLRAAALLRITDAELHRMQTVAGIAEENAADHLWTPADDPFPPERKRNSFRSAPLPAADLEIVATDRELAERIASRKSAAVSGDAAYRSLRAATVGGDARPTTDEAAFLYFAASADDAWRGLVPAMLRSAPRELRESAGLRWLAEKWIGARADSERLDPHPRGPSILASIRSIRVTTDARGAAVAATCRDSDAAQAAAHVLAALPSGGPAADRACVRNLEDLVPLALVENPQDDVAERNFVVLGWQPVCPCGGTYSVHPVTRETSCSVHGTAKSPRKGAWTPPPVSEVRADGAELSFRIAIDWNRKE